MGTWSFRASVCNVTSETMYYTFILCHKKCKNAFSGSTRKATDRRYNFEDIRNAMACVLTDAPRAPGGPLHKV